MGITKRELLEDYYLDEFSEIVRAWNEAHNPDREEQEEVDPMSFMGGGGEMIP